MVARIKTEPATYLGGSIVSGYSPGGSISVNTSTYIDKISGNTNPNWRDKVANHSDASSAYLRVSHEFKQAPFWSSSVWWDDLFKKTRMQSCQGYPLFGPTAYNSMPVLPEMAVADDIAIKRLKGKLARDLDQFQALVPLAEIKETRNLIRSTAEVTEGLLKSLIQLKHGKVRDVASRAGAAWLQFSFAISPTISDVNSLASSISSYLTRNDHVIVHKGNSKRNWSSSALLGDSAASTNVVFRPTRRQAVYTYTVQYTAGVNVALRSANNYGVADHFGLDFGSLPSVAWELIPFSWVVDYFSTTGAYLDDVFTSPGVNTFYCTKSSKLIVDESASYKMVQLNPGYATAGHCPSQSSKTVIFSRDVLSQLPSRTLRFKTADEIGINSIKRVLNLASILVAK